MRAHIHVATNALAMSRDKEILKRHYRFFLKKCLFVLTGENPSVIKSNICYREILSRKTSLKFICCLSHLALTTFFLWFPFSAMHQFIFSFDQSFYSIHTFYSLYATTTTKCSQNILNLKSTNQPTNHVLSYCMCSPDPCN